eukprot:bmy_18589T0
MREPKTVKQTLRKEEKNLLNFQNLCKQKAIIQDHECYVNKCYARKESIMRNCEATCCVFRLGIPNLELTSFAGFRKKKAQCGNDHQGSLLATGSFIVKEACNSEWLSTPQLLFLFEDSAYASSPLLILPFSSLPDTQYADISESRFIAASYLKWYVYKTDANIPGDERIKNRVGYWFGFYSWKQFAEVPTTLNDVYESKNWNSGPIKLGLEV